MGHIQRISSRVAPVLGLLIFVGCADVAQMGTPAHRWDHQAAQRGPNGQTWPDWPAVSYQPIPLSPDADKAGQEYAAIVWDDTGIYGLVYGLACPAIEITCTAKDGQGRKLIIDADQVPPPEHRQSLGILRASDADAPHKHLPPALFRYVDRGWLGQAGQCQSEFWLAWSALPNDGHGCKTVMTVAGHKLCFPWR